MAIKSWLRIRAGLAYPTLLRWECRCDAVLEMVLAQGRARAPLIVLGRVLSVSLVLLSAPTQSLDLFVGGSSFASSDLAGLEGGLSVIVVVRVGLFWSSWSAWMVGILRSAFTFVVGWFLGETLGEVRPSRKKIVPPEGEKSLSQNPLRCGNLHNIDPKGPTRALRPRPPPFQNGRASASGSALPLHV